MASVFIEGINLPLGMNNLTGAVAGCSLSSLKLIMKKWYVAPVLAIALSGVGCRCSGVRKTFLDLVSFTCISSCCQVGDCRGGLALAMKTPLGLSLVALS
jgi:hypothetical protein